MKRLWFFLLSLALLISSWAFWSNSQVEKRRYEMKTLTRGMSRAEIEARLAKPDDTRKCVQGQQSITCLVLHYSAPTMEVTLENDAATAAYFYEGKSEIPIFE
ncbi:MAG: hypothetical protein EOO57_03055 [Hymenobacter sp.]|nr:MAG: hypothetical protein EOO57_03055 [Hymenobacter sp.]